MSSRGDEVRRQQYVTSDGMDGRKERQLQKISRMGLLNHCNYRERYIVLLIIDLTLTDKPTVNQTHCWFRVDWWGG